MASDIERRVALGLVSSAFLRWLAAWKVQARIPFEGHGGAPAIRRLSSGGYLWR